MFNHLIHLWGNKNPELEQSNFIQSWSVVVHITVRPKEKVQVYTYSTVFASWRLKKKKKDPLITLQILQTTWF